MRDTSREIVLAELIQKELDGVLPDEQFALLQDMLAADPEAVDYYVKTILTVSSLHEPQGACIELEDPSPLSENPADSLLWQALLEHERTAPETIIPKVEPPRELIQKVVKPKVVYKVNKFSLYTVILSAAAMLLFALWLQWVPAPSPIVATLTKSVGAEWALTDEPPVAGDSLREGNLILRKGFAQLYFDDGVEVVVRAPATLKLEGSGQLFIESGNIAVKVEDFCDGFLVRTAGATIVDYGTEFGVIAHADGRTEVHVFDGEVGLRTGSDPLRMGESMRLQQGQASSVDCDGQLSTVIAKASPRRFVRQLPDSGNFALPGHRIDLADMVGGGNGLGTGFLNGGINAGTGGFYENYWDHSASGVSKPTELGPYRYNEVAGSAYVDGVFVPNDKAGPLKVSSQGHQLLNCPVTSGDYYKKGIINGAEQGQKPGQTALILLDEKEKYGTHEHPVIMMRRNKGITFDLEAIRADIPGCRITRFRALAGISDSILGGKRKGTFMVLIDGKVRFMRSAVTPETGGIPIDLELDDNDRFLTLITAYEVIGGTHVSIFAEPTLELEYDN